MRPYRDAVTRMSMRQLRAQFSPRAFAELDQIVVQAGGAAATVKIVSVAAPSARGGRRRWLVCPHCFRHTSVVGLVPAVDGADKWACFQCARWKSRKACRTVEATR